MTPKGVTKTSAKWGAPRYEEIEFPWNKPDSKNPRVKGTGFQKNDHVHNLPSWVSNKGKPKRIIAPLPVPPKKPPTKPNRPNQPSSVGVQLNTPQQKITPRPVGQPKIVRTPKKKEKIMIIRKNGKLYIPRHMKEQFLRERAQSDAQSTMKSIPSVASLQQSNPSPVSTLKSQKGPSDKQNKNNFLIPISTSD